ncbi:MAG: PIN domain-containing protein, partial [Actinomycetota bacterium]
GPLVAATSDREEAHELAAGLVSIVGQNLVVLDVVMVEVDQLLRSRFGSSVARTFLDAIAAGFHEFAALTPALLNRANEFDRQYADLHLGLVDATVMAYAERHRLPILTFDFRDFRATKPRDGEWRLVIDEAGYREATSSH